MDWEKTADYWRRSTYRATAIVLPAGDGYRWMVYSRNQPNLRQWVGFLGRDNSKTLREAQQAADACLNPKTG